MVNPVALQATSGQGLERGLEKGDSLDRLLFLPTQITLFEQQRTREESGARVQPGSLPQLQVRD